NPAPQPPRIPGADQTRGAAAAAGRTHTQPDVGALSDNAPRHRPVTGAPCTARTGQGISGAALADTEGVRTCRRARPCPRNCWTGPANRNHRASATLMRRAGVIGELLLGNREWSRRYPLV